MANYRVISECKIAGERYRDGTVSIPPDQAESLVRAGCLVPVRTQAVETATADHSRVERAVSVDQYHRGAGWYEIPGVGKVRGEEAAQRALR